MAIFNSLWLCDYGYTYYGYSYLPWLLVLLGFSQAFTNPAALCALGRIVPPQV